MASHDSKTAESKGAAATATTSSTPAAASPPTGSVVVSGLKPLTSGDDSEEVVTSPSLMSAFLHSKLFSDWNIVVAERRYCVHRIVLCAASEYFRILFTTKIGSATSSSSSSSSSARVATATGSLDDDEDELPNAATTAGIRSSSNTTALELPSGTEEHFEVLMGYMYDHSVKLTPSNCVALYTLADMLIMPQLQRLIERYIDRQIHDNNQITLWLIHYSSDVVACPAVRSICIKHISTFINKYSPVMHKMSPDIVLPAFRAARPDTGSFHRDARTIAIDYMDRSPWQLTLDQLACFVDESPFEAHTSLSLLLKVAERASKFARIRAAKLMSKITMLLSKTEIDLVAPLSLIPLLSSDALQLPTEDDVVDLIGRIITQLIYLHRQELQALTYRVLKITVPEMPDDANDMYWAPLWRTVRWLHVSEDKWMNTIQKYVPAALAAGEAKAKSGLPNPDYPHFEVPRARPPVVLSLEYHPPPAATPSPPPAKAKAAPTPTPTPSPSGAASTPSSSPTPSATTTTTTSEEKTRPVFGPERPPAKSPSATPSTSSLNAPARIVESYNDWYDHISFRQNWRQPFATREVLAPYFYIAGTVVSALRNDLDVKSPGFKMRMVSGNSHSYLWTLTQAPNAATDIAAATNFVRGLIHATMRDGSGYVEGLNERSVDDFITVTVKGPLADAVARLTRVPLL